MRRVLRLIQQILILLINRIVRRKSVGYCVKVLSANMGLAYIKLAQILSMQDINGLFTERDRADIRQLRDDINPIAWRKISSQIPSNLRKRLRHVERRPIGSASVSQVHKAVLDTGEVVAIKIKRLDVEEYLLQDLKILKALMVVFGPVFGLSNRAGGKTALNMYYDWIRMELDFAGEVSNILAYSKFAESVNGKVAGCAKILVPKVYTELCTENVIVMEYVTYQTISSGNYSEEQIKHALNSYIELSFYALFHDMPVIFHGDPHSGNIYIDDNGNVGFLDMGLVFELDSASARDVRQLFFSAYFGNSKSRLRIWRPWFIGSSKEWKRLSEEVEEYCEYITTRPLTAYFMDCVMICMHHDIIPSAYLFGLAKAFVCLCGFDNSYIDNVTGHEMLLKQVAEYCKEHGLQVAKDISSSVMKRDVVSVLKSFEDLVNMRW